jgi:sulfite exporter TauE/SafE
VNPALLASVALAGFVGSLHCVGMCGPFVAVYASGSGKATLRAHAAYNLGRFATYTTLGALGGAIGHAVDLAGGALGFAAGASVLAGILIALFGLAGMLGARRASGAGPLDKLLARLAPRLLTASPTRRALILGLSSTLLPCGFLYAFVAAAASTGNPLSGALVMSAFFLGTLPMLTGMGLGLSRLAARLRGHVLMITSSLLFVLGIATIVGRLELPAFALGGARGVISADGHHLEIPKKTCHCHDR